MRQVFWMTKQDFVNLLFLCCSSSPFCEEVLGAITVSVDPLSLTYVVIFHKDFRQSDLPIVLAFLQNCREQIRNILLDILLRAQFPLQKAFVPRRVRSD